MQHMHYYLINHSFTSLKTNVHGSDHSESYCYNYITVNDTLISVQPPLESCIKKYHMGHWYVEYKKKEVKGGKKKALKENGLFMTLLLAVRTNNCMSEFLACITTTA